MSAIEALEKRCLLTAPVAVSDSGNATEDGGAVTINVTANDSDPDGDTFGINNYQTATAYGSVTASGGGLVYTPTVGALDWLPAGATTTDWIWYSIRDTNNEEAAAWVTITITGVNDAPHAEDDAISTVVNTMTAIYVRSNDWDVDSSSLTITSVSASQGIAVINTNGTTESFDDWIDFTPNTHTASTTVTYTVSDGSLSDTATVNVTIDNRLPDAVDDNFSTTENTAFTTTNVLANDTDPDGDTRTLLEVWDGGYGDATRNTDGTITYTPFPQALDYLRPGDTAQDWIMYRIGDGFGGEDYAYAIITITGVNDAPAVVHESYEVPHDQLASFWTGSLFWNDSDVEGDPLTHTFNAGSTTNGLATYNNQNTSEYIWDDSIDFLPTANYTGPASFTYSVSDGALTSTGIVNITVTNAKPVAANDSVTLQRDTSLTILVSSLLWNDSDADDPLVPSSISVSAGTNGTPTVVVDDNGTPTDSADDFRRVDFAPNPGFIGEATFTYTLTDRLGAVSVAGTVTVTITNSQPVAKNNPDDDDGTAESSGFTTDEDTPLTLTLDDLGALLDNDWDIDGHTLSVVGVNGGSQGTVTRDDNDTPEDLTDDSFTYTPNYALLNYVAPGDSTTDMVTYTIEDGHNGYATAEFRMTITGVNDKPNIVFLVQSGSMYGLRFDASGSFDPESREKGAGRILFAMSHRDYGPMCNRLGMAIGQLSSIILVSHFLDMGFCMTPLVIRELRHERNTRRIEHTSVW